MRSASSPSHNPTLYPRRWERKENPMQHRSAIIVSALLLALALASPAIAQGGQTFGASLVYKQKFGSETVSVDAFYNTGSATETTPTGGTVVRLEAFFLKLSTTPFPQVAPHRRLRRVAAKSARARSCSSLPRRDRAIAQGALRQRRGRRETRSPPARGRRHSR